MGGVEKKVDEARRTTALQILGGAGWVGYGLVHLLVAFLAVQVIFGDVGEQTDPRGAIEKIAQQPLGGWVLWMLSAGLIVFALWQFLLAFTGFGWVDERSVRGTRKLGAAGRGVMGAGIGLVAAGIASGRLGPGASSDTQQQAVTAGMLALPAGRLLVGALSIAILVVAVATVRRGVIRSFEEDLRMDVLPEGTGRWVRRIGIVGWSAKGVAYGVIGLLFGIAALHSDAAQAGGLDKALHVVAGQPYGPLLLAVVAAGFVAFAVFCFVAARAHRT